MNKLESALNQAETPYLFQLTGFDNRGVAVLVVGQAKQDVVADGPGHDPGSLWGEGDASTVSDLALRGHQLTQNHHQQGTLGTRKQEILGKRIMSRHLSALLQTSPVCSELK